MNLLIEAYSLEILLNIQIELFIETKD